MDFFRHIRQLSQIAGDISVVEYRWISPGMKDLGWREMETIWEQILRGYFDYYFHEDLLMRVYCLQG
jgi:hypothetical protein